jgi:transcriptional regulator with XRE-family HTH domain
VDVNELRELRRAADLSQRQLADFLTIAAKRLNSAGPRGGSRRTPFLLAMAFVAVCDQGRVERGHPTIT